MSYNSFLPPEMSNLKGALVLLDIDGTVTHDYTTSVVEPPVIEAVKNLAQANRVVAISNSRDTSRGERVARELGISYLSTKYRKPSRKITTQIDGYASDNTVVIGDKFLTDGLFAYNIGAKFYKANRLLSSKDGWKTKLIYLIDDVAYAVIGPFFRKILWRA